MLLSRRGKRRLLLLTVAALLLGVAALAFSAIKSAQQQRMAAQARADGLMAYRAGNLQAAIDDLSYCFQQNQEDLEVNMVLAEARARVPLPGGRHLFDAADLYATHALELLDRRGEAAPAERRDILQRLLDIYAQLGDRERVASTADALIAIDPTMTQAIAARAEVHYLAREFEQAEGLANRLIEVDPDSLTWRRMLLDVRSRRGETVSAQIEQCRAWAQQYTGDARFRLLTAAMLVDAGRMDEARGELHQVSALNADTREVLDQLVALMDVLGLTEDSTKALASAAQRFPDQWWPRECSIRRAWQRDENERALQEIAAARAALTAEPSGIRRLEVVALIASGRRAEALAALQPLMNAPAAEKEHDDDRNWATAVSAVLSAHDDQWRGAANALEVAISAAPHDSVLQFLLGDVSQRVGEQARAIAAYQQAYLASPNWTAAGVAFSRVLLDAGRLDEAFNIARLVVTRSGVDRMQPFLQYVRCVLALREAGTPTELISGGEMIDEIADALGQLLSEHPGEPEIASLRARALLAVGDAKAADAFMREVAQSRDVSSDMLLSLADVARQNRLETERALVLRAREIDGLSAGVALALADLELRDGRGAVGLALIDEALAEAALEPASNRPSLMCARVGYLLRMNEASALAGLSALIGEFPDSVSVQRFALAQPAAWNDQRIIAQAMGNLHRLLGDDSMQVRLAEASFLLRNHGRDPAMVKKAVAAIELTLEQAPESIAALSLAAEAAMLGERPDLGRAADCLERAVTLFPGEPGLLTRLISTLQRQGRFDVARRHLQSLAAVLERHPEFVAEELRLLQAQGDFESALVRAASTVGDASPPPQQLLLASVLERTGRVAEAEAVYDRLLQSNGDMPLVMAQAAEFYASTGRYGRGLELIQQLPLTGESVSRELLVGMFQQRHGRVVEAGESLRRAAENDPRNPDAQNELARHYLSIDEPMKAREQAMAGLRSDPAHVGLRSTLAIANLALPGTDRGEAIKLLREVGGKNDALLAMLELLEKVPLVDGRPEPTADNLAAARQLTDAYGLFLPAWQMAMAMHIEAGRQSDAIIIARDAVGRLPGEPLPAQWATQLLMQAGRWDEALAEAQEWRRRTLADPIAADAAAARILIIRERTEDAVELLSPHEARLVDERARFPDRLLTLVEALVRTGDVARAERIMTPLIEEAGPWSAAWIDAARLMPAADAERVLNLMDGRARSPEERLALTSAWLGLAQQSGSESHLARVDALLEPLERDSATAVGALITRGAVAEARGDFAAAERAYRAALAAAPQNAVALNNLAYALARLNRFADALPHVQQALKLQPDQPDFLDTLSVVLRGTGKNEEAELALRHALAGRPNDPALMFSLIDVLLEQGKRDDAEVALSQMQRRSATLDARMLQRLEQARARLGPSPPPKQDAASGDTGTKPTVP